MLRLLVLALVLANAGYFVWSQGWLAIYGLAPVRQAEPERLAQQIRPETMQLLSEPEAAPPALAAAPAPPIATPSQLQCLEAGPFTDKQADALERRLRAASPALLSGSGWVFDTPPGDMRWIVYMGRYSGQEALAGRRAALRQLGVAFETPVSPLHRPGLSLGSFGSKAEAETALAQLADDGVRGAKVVVERPEVASQWLKFPAADASLRSRLESLKPPLLKQALQTCT